MSTTAPTLADILNKILQAVQSILYSVADAIAANASVIGTVIVLGGLAYLTVRYGSKIFRGVTRFLSGLF